MTSFSTSLIWYLYLFVVGVIFLPLTMRIFRRFLDVGYPFAKTVGIILISYSIFLLGLLKILPFSKESLVILLLVFIVVQYKFFYRELSDLKKLSFKTAITFILQELLFFISFIFYLYIRGQEPSIHGLEKFMDFGFIQSIGKSQYFPPLDMWLSADPENPAGYPINYYYFGHLTGAMLIKLSSTNPFIGYNLILGTIFAQGITLAFSLVSNMARFIYEKILKKGKFTLLKYYLYGLLGAFIINLAGNLHTIYIFTKGYPNENPVPFWGIFQNWFDVAKTASANHAGFFSTMIQNSKYWYPNATRFIPFTIHEFPEYSYVVADLHGHVFDIPFVLLTLALIFTFYIKSIGKKENKTNPAHKFGKYLIQAGKWISAKIPHISKPMEVAGTNKDDFVLIAAIGFLIAINYMTNAFDGPIYLLFMFLILFIIYKFSIKLLSRIGILIASFIIFSYPFSINFAPFATGIGVNCSPNFLTKLQKLGPFLFEKGNCQISEPWMLFVLWGFFIISFVLYISAIWINKKLEKGSINLYFPFLTAVFLFGFILLTVPEFFYAKDIYPAHFRANTMFKLGYQAFIMMGIGSTLTLMVILALKSVYRYLLLVIFLIFFSFIFIYPFIAFPSFYPGLYLSRTYQQFPNLDGSAWMYTQYSQDKEIIDYINRHFDKQIVILEAQGDSYTDYDRVSAYTGMPTVAGWWVHQWLWRGSSDVVGSRIPDIEALYQSDDIALTRELIKKYHIEYIVVSQIEHEKYPTLNEEKMKKIGVKIFESSNGFGALYKVY